MFRFTPRTEEEMMKDRLIPEGKYLFKVEECEEKTGKSVDFFRIKFLLENEMGKKYYWYNNITLHPSFMYLLLQFCRECNVEDKYNSGALCADDFKMKTGMLTVAHKLNKNSYQYEDFVKYFGERKENQKDLEKPKENSKEPILDDDVPFI